MSGLTPPQGAATPGVATTRQTGVVEVSQSPFTGNPVALTTTDPVWLQLQQTVAQILRQLNIQQKSTGPYTGPSGPGGSGTTAPVTAQLAQIQLPTVWSAGTAVAATWPANLPNSAATQVSPDGSVHLLGLDEANAGALLYAVISPSGAVSTVPIVPPTAVASTCNPDLTLDAAGTVHCVWNDATDLWYTTVSPSGAVAPATRLTTNGATLLSLYGSGYLSLGPGGTSNGGGPAGQSLAVDANGVVHVVAGVLGSANGSYWGALYALAFATPTAVPAPTTLLDPVVLPGYSTLAVWQTVNTDGTALVFVSYTTAGSPSWPQGAFLAVVAPGGTLRSMAPIGFIGTSMSWIPVGFANDGQGTGWMIGLNSNVPQLEGIPVARNSASYADVWVIGNSTAATTQYAMIPTPQGLLLGITDQNSAHTLAAVATLTVAPKGAPAVTTIASSVDQEPFALGFGATGPVVGFANFATSPPSGVALLPLQATVATSGTFVTPPITLPTAQSAVTAYVDRAVTVSTSLTAAVAAGGTSLSVLSAHDLNAGDTLELDPGTSVGERVTISSVTGTTLTLSAGTKNAHNQGALVNRVDVLAEVSLVAAGTAPSFSAMTWVSTAPSSVAPGAWSDTYTYSQATAEPDLTLELQLSAGGSDVAPSVAVYQYGLVPGVG